MRSSFCWAVWSSLGSQTAQCRVFPSVKHPGTAQPRPWAVRASPCAPQLRLGPWQWPHKGGAAPSSVLAGHSRCRGGAAGSVAGSRSPGLAAGQPSGPAVRGAACAACPAGCGITAQVGRLRAAAASVVSPSLPLPRRRRRAGGECPQGEDNNLLAPARRSPANGGA